MRNGNGAVSFEEALKIVSTSVSPLGCEEVSVFDAYNRILYSDIVADMMIPPFDESAMDGYAIIADDTLGATSNNPVDLKIVGEIKAGESIVGKRVSKGTAIRIMTGAMIPKGADSVIRIEDTMENSGYVKIFRAAIKYENRKFAGENIKKGDTILRKGDWLDSADIGILASLNYSTVKVYKQPNVAIISTGIELVEPDRKIHRGQIRNANAYSLYSEVKKYNAIPDYLGIAQDTLTDTKAMFLRALKHDVVISTGGVSVGKYDFVKDIYSDLNIEIQFERVNVKPGMPCVFGKRDNQLYFGLPGNPVPTLTSFIQFVRPALLTLMGATEIKKPVVNAFLEEDIKSVKAHHLVRGFFTVKNNEFYVSTTGNQKPSFLRSMSMANCLIIIPEDITEARAGEKVKIQLVKHHELRA